MISVKNSCSDEVDSRLLCFSLSGEVLYQAGDSDCWSTISSTIGSENSHLSIYPIPVTEYLNVKNEDNILFSSYTITDIHGRSVLKADYAVSIDTRGLVPGVYFLTLEGKDTIYKPLKFIKQ